jgi:hypothetical protein
VLGYKELNGFNGLTRTDFQPYLLSQKFCAIAYERPKKERTDLLSNIENTLTPEMVDCPKCGFQQPADRYCAKCGIDMIKLRKNPAAIFAAALKKPGVLAIIAVIAIILTISGVRSVRTKRMANASADSRSQELRARVSEKSQNIFLANDPDDSAQTATNDFQSTDTSFADSQNNLSSTSSQVNETETVATAAKSATASPPGTGTTAGFAAATSAPLTGKSATEAAELQVTFAWAEASREWLQAMGASTPGLHRVTALDAKLRESVGGYRILEVTRQKMADKSATTTLVYGDRLSVRFESTAANDSTLVGSIQPAMRAGDGSVRSPAAAAVSIDKGQGSIVTLGVSATPIAAGSAASGVAAPTGAEIVLLILPRWEANRNP